MNTYRANPTIPLSGMMPHTIPNKIPIICRPGTIQNIQLIDKFRNEIFYSKLPQ